MTALLSLILYSRLRHRGRAEGSTIALALDRFAGPALDAAVPVEAHRQIRIAVEQAVAEALACVGALNGGWPAVAIDLARRRMLEEWAKQPAISMSEEQSRAEKYRREAAEIRSAAEIVRDEGFRQQLLSIADEYDAVATSIEVKIGPNERPDRARPIGTAKTRSGRRRRRTPGRR